jgi:hypothetical protein
MERFLLAHALLMGSLGLDVKDKKIKGSNMTEMTIVDVVNILYPNQFTLGNVSFGAETPDNIIITSWNVPDVEKPSVESLVAQIPALQSDFNLTCFNLQGTPQLTVYIDSVAQSRRYDNAAVCASYVSSTVPSWALEARTFIGWRDALYIYVAAQYQLMEAGTRTVPTFAEFQTELPVITWPS